MYRKKKTPLGEIEQVAPGLGSKERATDPGRHRKAAETFRRELRGNRVEKYRSSVCPRDSQYGRVEEETEQAASKGRRGKSRRELQTSEWEVKKGLQ